MDSVTRCSLITATVGATIAAFIAAWLLLVVMPLRLFFAIVSANVIFSVLGSLLPSLWSRWRRTARRPLHSICASMVLSSVVGCSILVLDFAWAQGHPVEDLLSSDNIRLIVSVCSNSMSISISVFLLHWRTSQFAPDVRRVFRRIKRLVCPGPEPKLVIVDSFDAEAPGDCAICLDPLASLPAELAHVASGPVRRMPADLGLLRFHCGHMFHATCAEHWMRRELLCPLCRRQVGLGSCTRICLHPKQHVEEKEDAERQEKAQPLPTSEIPRSEWNKFEEDARKKGSEDFLSTLNEGTMASTSSRGASAE
mmetsp:Transcript_17910/g.34462  ORF Transcript_17910/g.34462 Transcript_17910/m.34462 type:complete len:310 (-) Transcript_17910:421-1350(-)